MVKLIYLVSGPMGRTPAGQAELERRRAFLKRHAAAETEIDITDIDRGPGSIESMFEEYLSIPATAQRAYELQREGWDGILLGCYGDPGLDALRELVDIPVVGAGEATALMAASLGHRFSIITVTQSVIAAQEKQMKAVGIDSKLASVRAVDIPVLDLRRDREQAIEACVNEGRKAIEQDRADTLICGCMSMGFLEIAEQAGIELGVPFLNPARVQLKWMEAMLGAGLTHSRRAYMTPPKLASGKAASPADLYHIKQN